MGIYSPNTTIIQESYFGQSKELIELETAFSKIRSKYVGAGKHMTIINTDKDLIAFNRACEKFFGFKTFALVIEPNVMYNAYTCPLTHAIDTPLRGNLETAKSGWRYKEKAGFVTFACINSALFYDRDFTDREVLAILFHEIGHNFSSELTPMSTAFAGIGKLVSLLQLIVSPLLIAIHGFKVGTASINSLEGVVLRTSEKIRKEHPWISDSIYTLKGILSAANSALMNGLFALGAMGTIMNPVSSILGGVSHHIQSLVKNPMKIIRIAFGYNDEKVSDAFATSYGFGADLSSALFKLKNRGYGLVTKQAIDKMPIIGHMYDLFSIPVNIVASILDEHPENCARINSQLKYLQKELSKENIDPKLKKQIDLEIKKITDLLDTKFYNVVDDGEGQYFSKCLAGIALNLFGGDVREIFSSDLNKKFDKAADRTFI